MIVTWDHIKGSHALVTVIVRTPLRLHGKNAPAVRRIGVDELHLAHGHEASGEDVFDAGVEDGDALVWALVERLKHPVTVATNALPGKGLRLRRRDAIDGVGASCIEVGEVGQLQRG